MPPPGLRSTITALKNSADLALWLKRLNPDFAAEIKDTFERSLSELTEGIVHVAVIGSFSSGKSTLVNRLVGEDVLPTGRGVVTARPVLLEPGSETSVGWRSRDAEQKLVPGSSPSPSHVLRELQSNPPKGDQHAWLKVAIRDWPFSNRLRLIDTPGFDSEDPSHRTMTLAALADASAALVVVEPRGMSQDVREFVVRNVAPHVPTVALVVNQLDTVDSEEIPEIVTRTMQHAVGELGLSQANVIACSAKGVVDPEGRFRGYAEVRTWIYDIAGPNLERIVAARIAEKMTAALGRAREQLRKDADFLRARLAEIENQRSSSAHESLMALINSAIDRAVEATDQARVIANQKVEQAGDTLGDELVSYLRSDEADLSDAEPTERAINRIFQKCTKTVDQALTGFAQRLLNASRSCIADIDQEVATRWSNLEVPRSDFASPEAQTFEKIRREGSSVSVGELPTDAGLFTASVLGGAALGTVVPVIGTVLGAITGFLGALFFSDAQDKAIQQICEAVSAAYSRVVDDYNTQASSLCDAMSEQMDGAIGARVQVYGRALDKLSAELRSRSAELAREQCAMDRLAERIDSSLTSLERYQIRAPAPYAPTR